MCLCERWPHIGAHNEDVEVTITAVAMPGLFSSWWRYSKKAPTYLFDLTLPHDLRFFSTAVKGTFYF